MCCSIRNLFIYLFIYLSGDCLHIVITSSSNQIILTLIHNVIPLDIITMCKQPPGYHVIYHKYCL